MTGAPAGRTALYRFFDKDDQVIYVGISNNPRTRWQGHAADKPWWTDVVTREVEWFGTRKDAERAERREIGAHYPKWNTAPGMPDRNEPEMRRAPRKGWTPPASLVELFAHYEQQQEATGKARDELEQAIVAEMRTGVSGDRMAKYFPWEPQTFRRISKAAGIPPLRDRTVVSARKAALPEAE
ncbi:GIY-YIG nuclease family protein [Streptomyces sp. NPDC005732]|uniref:GIY-YIG nuclease family protein n=1 Tax=Streptomyces sp. NPDC005732 TaxID=3157057 RepID=UPI003408B859